ncbi:MAG: DUF4831 family protein [Bacteroidota bacterium]|nr:DUF4831 family protein [Bacteroidota bacterium]
MRRIPTLLLIPILVAPFLFGIGACTSTEYFVNKTRVEKLVPGSPPSMSGFDYALPRTVLDVELIAEKTITKPGPFAEYAERYLGVSEVPTREKTEWIIKDISLKSHAERDPDQIYRVETEGISKAGMIQLDERGIIVGVNVPLGSHKSYLPAVYQQNVNHEIFLPEYPDLTIRKNTEPMMDTIYRVVRTDTSFTRLPLLKSQVSQKTLMNQAEEAANLIMKLRKRRFFLLAGEYAYRPEVQTPMPEGAALEVIVRELAQLEYDYVSLFIGRTITENMYFSFSYTPEGKGQTEADDLFVFSRFRGVLPAGNSNGDPVRIQLSKVSDIDGMYSNTEFVVEDDKTKIEKGLAYRVPGQANVSLRLNNEDLIKMPLLIAQYGVIQYLPSKLFEQENVGVEYHPQTGLVKHIFNTTGL